MDTIKLIDQDPSITLLYEPRILELENKQIMHNKQSNLNNGTKWIFVSTRGTFVHKWQNKYTSMCINLKFSITNIYRKIV